VKLLTGTKKKTFYISTTTAVSPRGGWSGGSRSYFSGLNYKTGKQFSFQEGDNFYVQTTRQELPVGCIMIETGVFCGKPSYPRIYCRPEELAVVMSFLGLVERPEPATV